MVGASGSGKTTLIKLLLGYPYRHWRARSPSLFNLEEYNLSGGGVIVGR